MPKPTLQIEQQRRAENKHTIKLTLERPGQPRPTAATEIEFALTAREQEDPRWYMEDYLQRPEWVTDVEVAQIEAGMQQRGEELYTKVLAANLDAQALWFAIRERLADLRIEITTSVADAASIPWELMRDPRSDSAIALRAEAFVRVHSNPPTQPRAAQVASWQLLRPGQNSPTMRPLALSGIFWKHFSLPADQETSHGPTDQAPVWQDSRPSFVLRGFRPDRHRTGRVGHAP